MANVGGFSEVKNMGAGLVLQALGQYNVVGNSNAAANLATIDRIPQGPQKYDSAVLAFAGRHNTASGQTWGVALVIQDSADGSTWASAPANAQPTASVSLAGAGAATLTQIKYNIDLSNCRRYVRVNIDGTSSDGLVGSTLVLEGLAILGGASQVPGQASNFVQANG